MKGEYRYTASIDTYTTYNTKYLYGAPACVTQSAFVNPFATVNKSVLSWKAETARYHYKCSLTLFKTVTEFAYGKLCYGLGES